MSGDIEKLDIKWLDIIKKYNIFNEVAYVSTGDIGLVIAARKFYELSNLSSTYKCNFLGADNKQ